jgi:GTP-binding protein
LPLDGSDPVQTFKAITEELSKYSEDLTQKERWLVLNKIDQLPEGDIDAHCDELVKRMGWTGKVFKVSGLAKLGLAPLVQETMRFLEGADHEEDWL